MASNADINSNNKVVQSLDLYTNDLLNVSKIIGNKPYSNRSRNLEISTRDVSDTGNTAVNAGNLLLRAGVHLPEGTQGLGTSGYVHIFAGNVDEPAAASIPASTGVSEVTAKGIVVTDKNKVSIGTSDSITLQTTTSNNSITLANSGQTLTVKNTTETHTSDILNITVNKALSFLGKSNSGTETPFEISISDNSTAGQSKATLTVSDLHINNDIKLGNVTGNTQTARGKAVSNITVTGNLGETDIGQTGLFKFNSNSAASNPTGSFSITNNSSPSSTDLSSGQSLLTIQHENITEKAYINTLDVHGNIRLGSFSTDPGYPTAQSSMVTAVAGSPTLTAKLSEVDITTASNFKVASTQVQITGSNDLLIEAASTSYPGAPSSNPPAKSFIRAKKVQVTEDFYGNNVHMYWDADTNSLVFARVNS